MRTLYNFFVVLGFFLTLPSFYLFAQVSINNDNSAPNASAMLDVKSANKGVLFPRISFDQRNAIVYPAEGLIVFCIDCGTIGAISVYTNDEWRTYAPCSSLAPAAGAHVALPSQITWNWSVSPEATGYRWNTMNNYSTATDMSGVTTKTETALACNTLFTRFIWAYYSCGTSSPTALTMSTMSFPSSPVAGTHVPTASQITWNWNTTLGTAGYKWNTTNNYSTAIDMGLLTTKTETGKACNTAYTCYIWAYNVCGNSASSLLTQTTLLNPEPPTAGTHVPGVTQIVWKWNPVAGATGYKWSVTNNFANAVDMGTSLLIVETGLACNTNYTRYAWAYGACGNSTPITLTQATFVCPVVCGSAFTINHLVSGGVAPVDKTVTYGTATNIPGELTKCWITRNLGSALQATGVSDATEASAGWYFQFNCKQGYQYISSRIPATTWISSISESSNWTTANDPCTIELGTGWRIPTNTEWTNVDASWTNWNGPFGSALKLHAAGLLSNSDGSLGSRSSYGYYWSSVQGNDTYSWYLVFSSSSSNMGFSDKAFGFSARCVRDF